jgi:hypothetical protein
MDAPDQGEVTGKEVIEANEFAIAQLVEMKSKIEADLPQLGAEITQMCTRSFVPVEERQQWMEWVAKLVIYHAYVMNLCDTLHQLMSANIETVYALEELERPTH